MSDLDRDPFMPALGMTLSEASKLYGNYILVANDLATRGLATTDETWRMYNHSRTKALSEVSALEALLELIMKLKEK